MYSFGFLRRGCLFSSFFGVSAPQWGLACWRVRARGQFNDMSQVRGDFLHGTHNMHFTQIRSRPNLSLGGSSVHLVPRAIDGLAIGGWDQVLAKMRMVFLDMLGEVAAKAGVMAIAEPRDWVDLGSSLPGAVRAIADVPLAPQVVLVTSRRWPCP